MVKVVYNACFGGFNLSDEAKEWLSKRGFDNADDYYRHDSRLVECVEKFGEEANGPCSDLRIAKIKGKRYFIKEYDGREHVVTPETIPTIEWIEV